MGIKGIYHYTYNGYVREGRGQLLDMMQKFLRQEKTLLAISIYLQVDKEEKLMIRITAQGKSLYEIADFSTSDFTRLPWKPALPGKRAEFAD